MLWQAWSRSMVQVALQEAQQERADGWPEYSG